MAKAYISEYSRMIQVGNGLPQIADESSLQAEYAIDFTSAEVHGANFQAATTYIRINTDAAGSFKIANAAVATTSNKRFSAGQTEYFALGTLNQGTNTARISFIANT